MIPYNKIVVSILVKDCLHKKIAIKQKLKIDISKLDEYEKIEMWLIDAQDLELVAKR